MKAEKEYHALVLGKDLGAYLLALHLVQHGLRVKILEPNTNSISHSAFASTYDKEGTFLGDASWEPILGFYPNAPEEKFLRSLGLYEEFSSFFCSPQVAPVQILSTKKRIDCSYPIHRINWEEEYPEKKDLIQKLWGAFYAHSASSSTYFSSLVRNYGLDEEWMSWGASQLFLYGDSLGQPVPLSSIGQYVANAEKGLYFLKGGRGFVRILLLDALARYRVIPEKIHMDHLSILYKRGVMCGVELGNRSLFSPWVIGAMEAEAFLSHIPKRYHFAPIKEQRKKRIPKAFRFHFSFSLPVEYLPEGIGSHFCFHLPEAIRWEDYFFQVLRASSAYKGLPLEKEVFLVRLILPYSSQSLQEASLLKAIRRSMNRLKEIFPSMEASSTPYFSPIASLEDIPPEQLLYEYRDHWKGLWNWDWENYGLRGFALCSRDAARGFLGEVRGSMEIAEKIFNS